MEVPGVATSLCAGTRGDILRCKVTPPPPRTALGFSARQSFTTQPGACLLCRSSARRPALPDAPAGAGRAEGSHQGRAIAGHLPPSPPSAAKSTGALRDAGEN